LPKEKAPKMHKIRFGRKKFLLVRGRPVLKSTSITVRTLPGEDEEAFTKRLLMKYGQQAGTVEMIFKGGHPDYAVITFSEQSFDGESGDGQDDNEN
jgi:hypothetical protein